ncbi:hypothetical protein K490DRAFT_59055 [Saccharata proteae CBS 121410]|uniref:Uncharacterized protein n=1 Tax=Saccharata proteae CBS 121410 TaxID=1314787 RepID=A0A9P4HQH0_9PEZI|nr:hypothetical protein K490DRAFT_59055 [Saccharata proteae CBS 121410]
MENSKQQDPMSRSKIPLPNDLWIRNIHPSEEPGLPRVVVLDDNTEESGEGFPPLRALDTVRRSPTRKELSISTGPDLDATSVPTLSKTPNRTSSKHARPSKTPGDEVDERLPTRRVRLATTPSVKKSGTFIEDIQSAKNPVMEHKPWSDDSDTVVNS